MTANRFKLFQALNVALLTGATMSLVFFCLKGPLFWKPTREMREDRVEAATHEQLKNKLLKANEYIISLEAVARGSHAWLLVACGFAGVASALNLALVRKKASDYAEKA